jgi:hypothetical protein
MEGGKEGGRGKREGRERKKEGRKEVGRKEGSRKEGRRTWLAGDKVPSLLRVKG